MTKRVTGRKCCNRCLRPLAYCYCQSLEPTENRAEIIILQHQSEQKHPLNTARILTLGLDNCLLLKGEDFTAHDDLNRKIAANTGNCWLLFPGEHAQTPAEVSAESIEKGSTPLIIVLDGTWRKARKIWHLSTNLHKLPFVALNDLAESNYRIRKAPKAGQLSTLEAVAALLTGLGQSPDSLKPMEYAFVKMIDMQIETMGADTFRQNYPQFADSAQREGAVHKEEGA